MYGQQMNMFQEGGVMLEDEGGEVEEASGNKVPLGGTKEGVADDQPANLSPGEMVLSADVVNYHGVEKVMSWRDEAKIGYHKMEAMGQLGNADEATIPTEAIFNPGGMPFSVVDLEYIDMEDDADVAEAASGMYVQDELNMQTGGTVPSVMHTNPTTGQPYVKQFTPPPPGTSPNITTLPVSMTPIPSTPTSASRTPGVITPSSPITQQPAIPTPSALPTTGEFFGGAQSFNQYINVDGNIIKIPVVNGQQTYPTPEGYQKYDPKKPKPFDPSLEQKDEEVKPETTLTQEPVIPPHLGGIGADDAFSAPDTVGIPSGEDLSVENQFEAMVNDPAFTGQDLMDGAKGGFLGLFSVALEGIAKAKATKENNERATKVMAEEAIKYDKAREVEAKEAAKEAAKIAKEKEDMDWRALPTPAGKPSAEDGKKGIGSSPYGGGVGVGAPSAQAPGAATSGVSMAGIPSLGDRAEFAGVDPDGTGEVAPDVAPGTGASGPPGRDYAGSMDIAEGGFVPKIKFKSNPKQRRKGLAARK